jgi:hypothetical protein
MAINENAVTDTLTPTTGTLNIVGNVTTPNSVNSVNTFSFKNRLINGSMQIDQRNSGSSQSIGLTSVYTIDRWYAQSTGIATTGQRISGSNGFEYSYQITGALTNTATLFGQKIESYNCYDLAGLTVTLSAYIASSALTSITWTAYYPTAVDNYASRTQIATGTFTINSTSTQYSVNISLPSNVVNGLQIEFTSGALTSGTITYTGIQLEKGNIATTFDYRNYGTELFFCQRYYEIGSYYCQAANSPGGVVGSTFAYKATKRSAPTVVGTATAGGFTANSFTTQTTQSFDFYGVPNGNGQIYGNWTSTAEL